jgi:HTH-type transcriptional regulator / antitoxin HipB
MDYPLNTADQLRHQLRALRKQRGLTQAALGALVGVTQARVVEIEANPGTVSLQQVMQVLNALGAGFVLRELQPATLPPAPPSAVRRRAGTAPSAPVAGVPPARVKKGSW